MPERIGLEAVLSLGSFSHAVSQYNSAISGMSKNTASTASSISSSFVGVGSGILKVGAIAAGAGLAGIAALTGGLVLLGSAALTEFAKYERMSLSIESLVARQLSQGEQVETQRTVAIGLTKKEAAELEGLAGKIKEEELSRNTLKARIMEQSEALRQLRDAHGAEALDVQTATARLAEMENQYQTSGAEIQELVARQAELSDGTQKYATVIEKVRTGQMSMTEAMAQAGPKAKELLGWISKLAINSPFSEEGVNQAFQTALAYGFTIDKAKELTAAELDFAAATGKSVEVTNMIALALGQMQAKGKVSGQEIIQLTNAGIGVNKILEDMGFTLDDVSNGLVDSDKFIQAVIDDMNVFKGAGAAQAATFSGLISTLGDLKAIGLREFFTGTFTTIQPYLADFVGMLTSAALETGSIRKLGDTFGTYVAGGLKNVVGLVRLLAIGDFTGGLFGLEEDSPFITALFRAREAVTSLYEIGRLLFTGDFRGGIFGLEEDAPIITTLFNIREAIEKIQGAFARFGVSGATVSILGMLGLDPETIGTINTTLFSISEGITTFIDNVMLAFDRFGASGAAFSILGQLGVSSDTLVTLKTTLDEIVLGVTDFVTQIQEAFTTGSEGGGLAGGLKAAFGEILANIPTILTEVVTGIATFLAGPAIPIMLTGLSEWGTAFWGWATTAIEGVGAALAGILLAISAWVASPEAQTQLNDIGKSLGGYLVTGVGLMLEQQDQWGTILLKVVGGLLAAVAIITADLALVGGQIVAGIISGILEKLGVDLQPATLTELKTILDNIASDGAIIAEFVGGEIVKGLETGMKNAWTAFKSAIKTLIPTITPLFAGIVTAILPYFEDTFKKAGDLFSGEKWMELGTSAIEGLLEGMKERAGDVLEFIKSLAADSLTGLGQFWGAESPARRFMPLGESVPQGIAVGINNASGEATQAIQNMGRNLLTSTNSALNFFDDLDAGGIAAANQVSNWNDLRDILQLNTSTAMQILASGGGSAGITNLIRQESANWGISPALAMSITESQGLMDHLMGTFNEFQTQMRLENLGNLVQMGGSFSGIAGTLAAQLEEQMGSAENATKALNALKDSGAKLDKSNLSLTDTLEDQQSKLAILQAELTELTGQEELDTIAIDKKKLAIEQLTEAMEENRKKIIENRQALVDNQQALLDMQMDLATGNQGDRIAFLQDFLASGEDSIRLIGEELGGIFAGTGMTSDVFWTRVQAQEELNRLLEEQRRQEELITQQKEAQGKLDKLKAQLDLINLGRQLGGNIFAGMKFGLDASVEDLLAATNAVTMAMVDQINHDLQIHSPSGVMIKTFQQVMAGAAIGVRRGESMLSEAMRSIPVLNGSMPQFSQQAGASNSSTYNYNFPMTVNTAATAQGVIMQYDVRRSLANV